MKSFYQFLDSFLPTNELSFISAFSGSRRREARSNEKLSSLLATRKGKQGAEAQVESRIPFAGESRSRTANERLSTRKSKAPRGRCPLQAPSRSWYTLLSARPPTAFTLHVHRAICGCIWLDMHHTYVHTCMSVEGQGATGQKQRFTRALLSNSLNE